MVRYTRSMKPMLCARRRALGRGRPVGSLFMRYTLRIAPIHTLLGRDETHTGARYRVYRSAIRISSTKPATTPSRSRPMKNHGVVPSHWSISQPAAMQISTEATTTHPIPNSPKPRYRPAPSPFGRWHPPRPATRAGGWCVGDSGSSAGIFARPPAAGGQRPRRVNIWRQRPTWARSGSRQSVRTGTLRRAAYCTETEKAMSSCPGDAVARVRVRIVGELGRASDGIVRRSGSAHSFSMPPRGECAEGGDLVRRRRASLGRMSHRREKLVEMCAGRQWAAESGKRAGDANTARRWRPIPAHPAPRPDPAPTRRPRP